MATTQKDAAPGFWWEATRFSPEMKRGFCSRRPSTRRFRQEASPRFPARHRHDSKRTDVIAEFRCDAPFL